jgi:lipopolysaccharide/colanic/teichoic acid biosynthesis glycosyltransferase
LGYRIVVFDVAAALAAPIVALWLRDPAALTFVDPEPLAIYVSAAACLSVCFFVLFRVAHGLPRYFSFHDAIGIAKASACAVTATAAFSFTVTRLEEIPRSLPVIHFLILVAMLISGRLLHRTMVQRRDLVSAIDIPHEDERSVIIVGAGRLAWFYVRLLDSFAVDNRRIAAVLDDDERLHGRSMFGHVILGGTQDVKAILDDLAVHGVKISGFIICERNHDRALELRDRLEPLCLDHGLQLELLAEKLGVLGNATEVEVRDHPTFPLVFPNADYVRAKRAIDATLATFLILVCIPLFLLTGLLVLIAMGSPIIFWQRRIGRDRRTIYVYKFKTMHNSIDRKGRLLAEDERGSRIGRFLRATRLDELPQLYNVIKGDMALVGPRPLLPADQPVGPTSRLAVAPGLTGWAQIQGGKLVTVDEKNDLDEWYVRNASPWLDLEIALRTVAIVLRGDRRNEDRLVTALARAAEDKKRWESTATARGRKDLSTFGQHLGRGVVQVDGRSALVTEAAD